MTQSKSSPLASQKIFTFCDDFVFKIVFGREGHERLLRRLLDALLGLEGDGCIKDLMLLNPFNLKETDEAKFTVVDVKAVDGRGRRFTVEVQARKHPAFVPEPGLLLGSPLHRAVARGRRL